MSSRDSFDLDPLSNSLDVKPDFFQTHPNFQLNFTFPKSDPIFSAF
jgi:hypothetical protein